MRNTLKIKLNPYKNINIISFQDRALAPYSELNNFMKEDFLKWADLLLPTAEREINDDFGLIVTGEQFEKNFLQDLYNSFEACKEYSTDSFEINYSIEERFQKVKSIADKYGIADSLDTYKIKTAKMVGISTTADYGLVACASADAFLIISSEMDAQSIMKEKTGPCIAIVATNESSKVICLGNSKYIWKITGDRFDSVINMIVDRFVKIPMILGMISQIDNISDKVDKNDYEVIHQSVEIDPYVVVTPIADLEVGCETEMDINVYPQGSVMPSIRIESSNPAVITVQDNKLIAVGPGKANIDIYKAEELIPFDSKSVSVVQDNFVKQIKLFASDRMGIDKTQQIKIELVPNDADDVNSVEWSIDNNNLALINNEGLISAKQVGSIVVTAKTKRAEASININILPCINNINVSAKKTKLYVGETVPIQMTISPLECYDSRCVWNTSDPRVAVIEQTQTGEIVIKATGIGECNLICTAIDGGASATCKVVVESTFKKRENKHTFLSYSFFGIVAAIICAVIGVKIGILAGAAIGVFCGVIANFKNKADRFWGLLLVIGGLYILLSSLGII